MSILLQRKWKITSVDEIVEKLEPLCIAGGNVKWCSHCGKQFGGSSKVKCGISVWFSNFTSRNIPKRIESRDSNRYLSTNVPNSIIHNSQKMETTQMSLIRWMDEQNMVCTYNRLLYNLRKEWDSDTCYNMNEPRKHYAKWNKPDKYYMAPLIGRTKNTQIPRDRK